MFFSRIRNELSTFTSAEKLFVLFSMLTGFCIASEYGITRPASSALFLTHFSAKAIPYAWLATVPLNLLVIALYNRYLPRFGPLKTLTTIALATMGINAATGLLAPHFPALIFFQFAWKDIYVLLMFKQFWSMIHITIPASRAKYLYGLIFSMGTIGSVLASLIPGFFAARLGTEQLFFFTIPVYTCLLLAYRQAFIRSGVTPQSFIREEASPKQGFSLIARSRFLIAVLLLVVFMQVSVGLMEFQFNAHLELNILEKDLRTEYMGRMVSLMNILSGCFQIFGSFLMVHTLGVRNSHLVIPFILLANGLTSFISPSFAILSLSFVFIKAVDFSLFGVIREMLYIPMQLDEKFRAKAVIDVFAYRTSKALVSVGILALQWLAASFLLPTIQYASIAVFVLWLGVVWFSLRKHYPVPA
jgi:AAA family ATP:ADP antiporter